MKVLLTILMLGLLVSANDSIKYYQSYDNEDTLKIYSEIQPMINDTTFFGASYYKWSNVYVYAETCVCVDVNVIIIKCSKNKPLIILE